MNDLGDPNAIPVPKPDTIGCANRRYVRLLPGSLASVEE